MKDMELELSGTKIISEGKTEWAWNKQ